MKKLLCYFIIAIMSLGLIGCGKEEKPVDKISYQSNAEFVFQSINENMSDKAIDNYLKMNDEKLDFILTYSDFKGGKFKTNAKSFKSILKAWSSAKEDFGKFRSKNQFEISRSNQGIEAKTEAEFENRDATLTLIFDDDGYVKDLNVNGHYSYGEIAEKAGMNTLLGMGTVFIMLIFISFVIYLFNFLPGGEKSRARKAKKLSKKNQNEFESENVITNQSNSDSSEDDSQLIAVITAAIAASTNKSGDSFVVRSIKRKANK